MSTSEDRGSQLGRSAPPQAPGLWRIDMQQHDLSVPGREVVQRRVEIGPEASPVRHTHPGEEIIYILEGSLDIDDGLRAAQVKSLVRGIESGMKHESKDVYRVDVMPIGRAQA